MKSQVVGVVKNSEGYIETSVFCPQLKFIYEASILSNKGETSSGVVISILKF